MSALQALLRESIDYAGLFPPAGLGMVRGRRELRVLSHRPARLGARPVRGARGPARRAGAGRGRAASQSHPNGWRIAALLGPDPARELEAIGEFNCRHAADGAGAAAVDVVEAKADSPETVERLLARIPAVPPALHRDPGLPRPRATRDRRREGGRKTQGPHRRRHRRRVPFRRRSGALPPRRARCGRALQGDGRTASSSPRRVPADLRARQRLRHHVRVSEPVPRDRVRERGAGRCRRGAAAGGARPTGVPLRRRRRRVAGTAARPRHHPSHPRVRHHLVRLLLVHRADRRPPVARTCSRPPWTTPTTPRSAPGSSRPKATPTSRSRTCPSASSDGAAPMRRRGSASRSAT